MALNIKSLQDIMRQDPGVDGDAQRMNQIIWILFLKIYDIYEKRWKTASLLQGEIYESIIPKDLAWDSWAKSKNEQGQAIKEALSGDELLDFINNTLFPTLKNLTITKDSPLNQKIVKKAFEDTNNYMKKGILLRQVINTIDDIEIQSKEDKKELSFIYESFLKTLQSAGNAGEFYTPRAVTDFVIQMLEPKIGDKIADLACGTGGFLTSAYHYLESQIKTAQDIQKANSYFYGIEKKQLPFILAVTGFLINGIENPNLDHSNTLEIPFDALSDLETFDIIAMNPPYGGAETKEIQSNFPSEFRSSETADLFMAVICERLAQGGKAAVVLPDGFLFGNDTAKINLKKKLLDELNLHLILRLPKSVFAPYTSITTNILFFTKPDLTQARGTKQTWFYRLDMPEGIKSFGKTKSMKLEHFDPFIKWNTNRVELSDESGNFKAKSYSKQELESRDYNFDLCGFVSEEEEILEPFALMEQVRNERERLNHTLDSIMDKIAQIIKDNA
ncbi:SAM-dependent methyltransferase [Helicobacter didelphidarum]|uniref:site-specific DNA-methyltransferase (adenine-specific) n=1 Tax=Helicobacter didelphidarum TaxID=2040648 RepID=A0A3D8IJE4_9HELI|nr:class I SAM-dependent DNA methyltransferase [Helicobacter didelphidarum]RDU65278.1 SAM-dependent methyltransferase [Helicobacter didelphidarum]